MASFMSTTFATGERKKKIITYGKLSRLPPLRQDFTDDDAPSLEQPHKHASTPNAPSIEPSGYTKHAQVSTSSCKTALSKDVFDVPSEDEFELQRTTPVKRPAGQRSKAAGDSRASASRTAAGVPPQLLATAIRPPQRPKPVKPGTKPAQVPPEPQKSAQEKDSQPIRPSVSTKSHMKASQVTAGLEAGATTGPRLRQLNTSSKNTSRATGHKLNAQLVPRPQPTKAASNIHQGKTRTSTAEPTVDLDAINALPNDDELSIPVSRAPSQMPRRIPENTTKPGEASRSLVHDASLKVLPRSNELGSLRNRKRKGSMSLVAAHKPVAAQPQEAAEQIRDRKVARRKEGTSSSREAKGERADQPLSRSTNAGAAVDRPRGVRTRTVSTASRPTMLKGQSSPAVLNRMLPAKQAHMAIREDQAVEVPASDDTMYDIPDTITTPVRPSSFRRTPNSTPGSVTPRQKDLFSTLLGASAAPKTPASALASLQLTNKKPISLLGALARSKSDISLGGKPQKTRLPDAFKDEDISSEEDDSESDNEVDDTIIADIGMYKDKTPVQAKRIVVLESSTSDRQVNDTDAADSQSSHNASGAATRPRLTYASQRSYLQEPSAEDDFLLSMDLDDSWKMNSQTVSTDDEGGPTSQPRTHHELKKYGQNTVFSWDMEESIREISDVSNKSMRRSAMMELCTKMADVGFVGQLLDSGFMHKLLQNMMSPGDVIFDFIAAVSVLFVLNNRPTFAIVDQIYRSGIMETLIGLIDKANDISRIARDRKSNMSKIAQESLAELRALLLTSGVWSSSRPEKVSPQLLAFETIDILTRNLRESGSMEALLSPIQLSKIISVCSILTKRVEATRQPAQEELLALDLAISILETVSIADQDYSTWPLDALQQLSVSIPVFFQDKALSKTVEAMKLCMLLTNNKPESCQPFSTKAFIGSLEKFIVARFKRLDVGGMDSEHRTRVLAELTLSLGSMINLAELSDQARANAAFDTVLLEVLVKTFITGSKRAAEASSVEESELSVVIGFLAVLLGMLCLNTAVRSQIQAQLPDKQLYVLLENMKQFARIHEHVDKTAANSFKGPEGQEALNDYYVRIMYVVEKLKGTRT